MHSDPKPIKPIECDCTLLSVSLQAVAFKLGFFLCRLLYWTCIAPYCTLLHWSQSTSATCDRPCTQTVLAGSSTAYMLYLLTYI